MPGSLPSSWTSLAIAPSARVSTSTSLPRRRHPRQAQARGHPEAGGHLLRLLRRQHTDPGQRLVDGAADHLLEDLAVAGPGLLADITRDHLVLAVDADLDHAGPGVPL